MKRILTTDVRKSERLLSKSQGKKHSSDEENSRENCGHKSQARKQNAQQKQSTQSCKGTKRKKSITHKSRLLRKKERDDIVKHLKAMDMSTMVSNVARQIRINPLVTIIKEGPSIADELFEDTDPY